MLKNIINYLFRNKFNLAIFLLYVIVCFTAMFYHEMWRDEARVWNFLNSYDIKSLVYNIRFDGHPFLWYIILFPFVKIGFPPFIMQVISVLFCTAAVLFFLIKSPFNYLIKFLFVFSAGTIYFLPVIARNYSLVPICVFALAYLYPERHKKPYQYLTALVLLSQTHCLMWGLFGICSVVFIFECIIKYFKESPSKFRDKSAVCERNLRVETSSGELYDGSDEEAVEGDTRLNKNKIFFIAPIFLIIYFCLMFFIYVDVFYKNGWNPELATSFISLDINDIDGVRGMLEILYKHDTTPIMIKILFGLFVTMFIPLFKISKKSLIFLVFSTFYTFYVLYKVWYGGIFYQKVFLIVLIIIFCIWISGSKRDLWGKLSEYILTVFLLFLMFNPFFINVVKDDIQNTYTNTKEIAEFIDNKENEIILLVTNENEGIILDNFFIFLKNEINHIVIPTSDNKPYILKKEDIEENNELPKYLIKTTAIVIPEELPYKKILSAPKNRVKIYDTKEYYSIYEKTE